MCWYTFLSYIYNKYNVKSATKFKTLALTQEPFCKAFNMKKNHLSKRLLNTDPKVLRTPLRSAFVKGGASFPSRP